MKYNFNRIIERRNTDCAKWDLVESAFGSSDVIPMWIADMDFPVARPITEALKKRTEHEIYGYTHPGNSLIEAVINRMRQKYNWTIEREWIVFTPGVIAALHASVKAYTRPGDSIILHEPVYYPFFSAVMNNGCHLINNSLELNDAHYEINFNDFEGKFHPDVMTLPSASRIRMMILSNPHNPVGRVWNREELIRMGEIIIRNDAVMVSDEIHCELLFEGYRHIPFASISKEFEQHSVVCMAATKTFNLAGVAASTIIIPNKKLRDAFNTVRAGILPRPNVFALKALEAAYRYGDEWLEQLLDYLQDSLEFLSEYFRTRIPRIKVIKPEGTYLVWLDCRELGMEPVNIGSFMREKAKVGLQDGYLFGPSGTGFQRINIACPRVTLEQALHRIESAVNNL